MRVCKTLQPFARCVFTVSNHLHVELQHLGASFARSRVRAPALRQIVLARWVAPDDILQHGIVSDDG